ncbi:MAG: TrmH family RNA methyltransferase [Spirochaetaceae bacterium]|nr:TrmH family RNA methyltransferase [Spirochaetaceae bacterium]
MIEPNKLWQLDGGQRRRKLALTFGALERDIAGIAEKGHEYSFPSMKREEYTKKVVQVLLKDPALPEQDKNQLETLLAQKPFDELRACNLGRNALLKILGTFPAEWDLIIAPHQVSENAKNGIIKERSFYPGLYVYAEDIRSPFNLGSIFRTAEAFGAEKVFLSPGCTNPEHPRAVRSAMGCDEVIPYERVALEDLPKDMPIFALETGGTDIRNFDFPKKGIVVIGSEELGVSPDALAMAKAGTVTIPMTGVKASLNVGVAFGILMERWTSSILS